MRINRFKDVTSIELNVQISKDWLSQIKPWPNLVYFQFLIHFQISKANIN